jgi:hypothetical protein
MRSHERNILYNIKRYQGEALLTENVHGDTNLIQRIKKLNMTIYNKRGCYSS